VGHNIFNAVSADVEYSRHDSGVSYSGCGASYRQNHFLTK